MTAQELWIELSSNLRTLRKGCGLSLRQVEQRSTWGRGTLSQIETGKARPTRAQVEWYDQNFNGDGLVVSVFAEARGAHGPDPRPATELPAHDGDAFEVRGSVLASGEAVAVGSTVQAGWTIHNAGTTPWCARRLTRAGAHHARRLIAGTRWTALPDCEPGESCDVRFDITLPDIPGTFAAYWQITDAEGRSSFSAPSLLAVTLLAR